MKKGNKAAGETRGRQRIGLMLSLLFFVLNFSLYGSFAASAKTASVQEGEVYSLNGYVYKVTDLNTKKKTGKALLVRIERNEKEVVMEDVVWIGKYRLAVNAIGDDAFRSLKSVRTFTTNTKLTKIGKNAFSGCKSLKRLVVKSGQLKTIGTNALKGISKNAKIEVRSKEIKKLLKGKGQAKTVSVSVTGKAKTKAPSGKKGTAFTHLPYDRAKYTAGTYPLSVLAPRADKRLLLAFDELDMKVMIDPKFPATGVFRPANREIMLKEYHPCIYHETGHFLFFLTGGMDSNPEAKEIFEEEKDKVTANNKSYVTRSPGEYFAESYRSYVLDRQDLILNRPKTYRFIKKALRKVTDEQIEIIREVYDALVGD